MYHNVLVYATISVFKIILWWNWDHEFLWPHCTGLWEAILWALRCKRGKTLRLPWSHGKFVKWKWEDPTADYLDIHKGQNSHASMLTFLRKGFRIGHEFRDCKCCLGFVAGVSFRGVGELCSISHCQPLPVCHFWRVTHLGTIYKHLTVEEVEFHLEDKFPAIPRNSTTMNFHNCHFLTCRLNVLRSPVIC